MQQKVAKKSKKNTKKKVSQSQKTDEEEQEINIYEQKEDLQSSINENTPKKSKSKKKKEKTPITKKTPSQKKVTHQKKMKIKYKLLSPADSGHYSESRDNVSNGSSLKYEKIKLNISNSPSPDYKGKEEGAQLVYTTHKDSENNQPFFLEKNIDVSNSSSPDKNKEKEISNENLQEAGSKSNLTLSNSNVKLSRSNSLNNIDTYHKRVKIKKKPNNTSLVNKNEIRQESIKISPSEKKHKKKIVKKDKNEFLEEAEENKNETEVKKTSKIKLDKKKKTNNIKVFTNKKLNLCPCEIELFYLTEKNQNPEKIEISTEKYKSLIDTEKEYKKLLKKYEKILKEFDDLKKQNSNIKTGKSVDTAIPTEKDPIQKLTKKNKGIRKRNENNETSRDNTISDGRATRGSSEYKNSLSKSKDVDDINKLIENHIENFRIIPEKKRKFLGKSINLEEFRKKFEIVENLVFSFDGIKKNHNKYEKDNIIIRENNKKLLPIIMPEIKKDSKIYSIKTRYYRFMNNLEITIENENEIRKKNKSKDKEKNNKNKKNNFTITNLRIFIDSGLNRSNNERSFESNKNCKITGNSSIDFSFNNEQFANNPIYKNDNYELANTKNINNFIESENKNLSEKLIINKINEINLRGPKKSLKNDYVITKLIKNNFNIFGSNVNATILKNNKKNEQPIITKVVNNFVIKSKDKIKKNNNIITKNISQFKILKSNNKSKDFIITKHKLFDLIPHKKKNKKKLFKENETEITDELNIMNKITQDEIYYKPTKIYPLIINKMNSFDIKTNKQSNNPLNLIINKINDINIINDLNLVKETQTINKFKAEPIITKNISQFKILKSNNKSKDFIITKHKLFDLIPHKKKNKKKLFKENETEITDELNIMNKITQDEIYYKPTKIFNLVKNKSFDFNLIINKINNINIQNKYSNSITSTKRNSLELKLHSIPKTNLIINKINSFNIIDPALYKYPKNNSNSYEKIEINKGEKINIKSKSKKKKVLEKSISTDANLEIDTTETNSIYSNIPNNKYLEINNYSQKRNTFPNIITKVKAFTLYNQHDYLKDTKRKSNQIMKHDFSNYSLDFSNTKEINLSIKSSSFKNIFNKDDFKRQSIDNISLNPQNNSFRNNSISSVNSIGSIEHEKKIKKLSLRSSSKSSKNIKYKLLNICNVKYVTKEVKLKFFKFILKRYFLKWLRETRNKDRHDSLKSSSISESTVNINSPKKEKNNQLKNLLYKYALHTIVSQICQFCEDYSLFELNKALIRTCKIIGTQKSFDILKRNYKFQLGLEKIENILKKHSGVFMFKEIFVKKELKE